MRGLRLIHLAIAAAVLVDLGIGPTRGHCYLRLIAVRVVMRRRRRRAAASCCCCCCIERHVGRVQRARRCIRRHVRDGFV